MGLGSGIRKKHIPDPGSGTQAREIDSWKKPAVENFMTLSHSEHNTIHNNFQRIQGEIQSLQIVGYLFRNNYSK
jgi:hypothetical protein